MGFGLKTRSEREAWRVPRPGVRDDCGNPCLPTGEFPTPIIEDRAGFWKDNRSRGSEPSESQPVKDGAFMSAKRHIIASQALKVCALRRDGLKTAHRAMAICSGYHPTHEQKESIAGLSRGIGWPAGIGRGKKPPKARFSVGSWRPFMHSLSTSY